MCKRMEVFLTASNILLTVEKTPVHIGGPTVEKTRVHFLVPVWKPFKLPHRLNRWGG